MVDHIEWWKPEVLGEGQRGHVRQMGFLLPLAIYCRPLAGCGQLGITSAANIVFIGSCFQPSHARVRPSSTGSGFMAVRVDAWTHSLHPFRLHGDPTNTTFPAFSFSRAAPASVTLHPGNTSTSYLCSRVNGTLNIGAPLFSSLSRSWPALYMPHKYLGICRCFSLFCPKVCLRMNDRQLGS